jgi:hypothetical protein
VFHRQMHSETSDFHFFTYELRLATLDGPRVRSLDDIGSLTPGTLSGQLVEAHVKRAHQLMHRTRDLFGNGDTPLTSRFSGVAESAAGALRSSHETVTR